MAENVNVNASPLSAANLTTQVEGAKDTMETPDTTPGAIVKGPTVKGGISVPGNVALDPRQTAELLANMQDMISQRTGGWHDFMSNLQDTMALVTPPRLGGPTAAMTQRAATKRQEQEDIFNMRAQMAALNAGQAQAQQRREWANQILGGGTGGAGGQGVGGTGAAPSLFGGGLNIPAETRAAITGAADPAAALQDFLTTAGKKKFEKQLDPAWGALTEVVGKHGQIEKVPLWQAVDLAMENPENPRNRAVIKIAQETPGAPPTLATAAAGAPKMDAEGIARSLGVPLTSGTRSYDKQAEMYAKSQEPGYTGPIVAKPETSRHVSGTAIDVNMKKVTPEQLDALRAAGFKQTVKSEPWHFELVGAPTTQIAAAPTTTRTDAAPGTAGSDMPPKAYPNEGVESLKKRTEIWQKAREKQVTTDIETAATSGVESRKKAGDMIAAVEQNAKKADEVINSADRVIGHAMSKPHEFGYAYQQENKPLALAASIPGVGMVVEKGVPALFGAKGESDRRKQTDSDASKLGLDFAAQMFSGTGARLGVGLEQMASNAKGVGSELPASVNALNANLVKVAAQKSKEEAEAWRKWRDTHGGDNADPYAFVQTPEYKQLEANWDKRLIAFDKELAEKFPDVYQKYEKPAEKKNRKPLNLIIKGTE